MLRTVPKRPLLTAPTLALIAIACVLAGVARAQPAAEPVPPTAAVPAPTPEAAPTPATAPEAAPTPATTPEAAPAPTPSAADASAEAEAARVLAETAAQAAAQADAEAYEIGEGPSVDLYGFMDFSFSGNLRNDLDYVRALYSDAAAFAVGSVNLYAASDLGEDFRSLLEVRFLYLPNGSLDGASGKRQFATALDYTDGSRELRWGGIVIERAWLEYSAHALLNLRMGQWLTPVGIWNVDHGTPTIIPSTRPHVIGEALFPLRQTGIELYGSTLAGDATLGYHLTLSNGRGNLDDYQDLDSNKALGARGYVTVTPLGTLTLGLSGYYGRSTSADVAVTISSTGAIGAKQTLLDQYDELGYAADVLWLYEGLHVQGELLTQELAYTDAGRPQPTIPVPGGGYVPDHRRVGAYGLVGYRLPWLTLMPFVMAEYLAYGLSVLAPGSVGAGKMEILTGGVNLRPTARVTLKLQFGHTRIWGVPSVPGTTVIDLLASQVAWSF